MVRSSLMMAPFSSSSLTAASNQASLRRRQLRYSNLSLTKISTVSFKKWAPYVRDSNCDVDHDDDVYKWKYVVGKNGPKIWAGHVMPKHNSFCCDDFPINWKDCSGRYNLAKYKLSRSGRKLKRRTHQPLINPIEKVTLNPTETQPNREGKLKSIYSPFAITSLEGCSQKP